MKPQFLYPWVLYFLWLAPLAGVGWHHLHRRREHALNRFMTEAMQRKLSPKSGSARTLWQILLISAALFLIMLSAARPQWGQREERVSSRGRDVVIAIDVSRSMLAADVRPNRLERAKADVLDLIRDLQGDRAAILSFRRTGVLLCPLTTDYAYLRQTLETLSPDSAPRGETSLGDAIDKAMEAFDPAEGSHKAIVLISDGEDLSGTALDAAARAGKRNIPVFTIGIGSPEGARIPSTTDSKAFMAHNGQDVVTHLEHKTLHEVATRGGGSYIQIGTASTANTTLGTVYREHVARLAMYDREETLQRQYVDRYQWFLFPAVLLLLAAATLSRGRLQIRPATRTATTALAALLLASGVNAQSPAPTNPPPGTADAYESPATLAIGAQDLFRAGQYDAAAAAYLRATGRASRRPARDYRYNAAAALYRAGKAAEAASLLSELQDSVQPGDAAVDSQLGAASFKAADDMIATNATMIQVRAGLWRDAAEAFKSATRAEAAYAATNLALAVKQVDKASTEARAARLTEKYGPSEASDLLTTVLKEQRDINEAMLTAFTNASPDQILQLEALSDRQKEAADIWSPLGAKLMAAASQPPASSNAQQQLQAIQQISEATQRAMVDSAERLRNIDREGANTSAARTETAIYNMWKSIAPYEPLLQEDRYRQTRALTLTSRAELNDRDQAALLFHQSEASSLTALFTNRFAASVPPGGTPPQAAVTNGPTMEGATEGISATNRQKILELAVQATTAQQQADDLVKSGKRTDAIPPMQQSIQLLNEIEKLLPKKKDSQQNQQQQKESQQKEEKKKPDEQKSLPKPDEQKPDEQKPEPAKAEEKKDKPPEDVQKLIEKALQREREHEEEKRRLNQRIPMDESGRDW